MNHTNPCAYKIGYQMVFDMLYHKKFLLDNDIINYWNLYALKLVIYFFWVYAIFNDVGHAHFYVCAGLKYPPSRVR